jgi:ribA/ribD-fused uncharacterized protein
MATAHPNFRVYRPTEVISFRKTREAFGGLSNMASGFPINICGVRIATSEALYQACRFPHLPDVQRLILDQVSPMTAKMRSKPYRRESRPDWDSVRIPIMKWCLRIKLAQNWPKFGDLLLETGDRPIVEDSSKDDFWGAMRDEQGVLRGQNVLGRLLMELREKLRNEPDTLETIAPVPIPDFLLLCREIPTIVRSPMKLVATADEAPDLLASRAPSAVGEDNAIDSEAIIPSTPLLASSAADAEPLNKSQAPRRRHIRKLVALGLGLIIIVFAIWRLLT